MTLLIDIIPSYLEIEVILSTEGGITSKGYHQFAIPLLHLAQLFRQISEFFALDINLGLLDASELCRQFTRELVVLKADSHKILHWDGIHHEIIRDGTSDDIAI